MSTYIIRSQGFFYTDEYWSPTDTFRRVGTRTYPTKAAAEKAARAFSRKWLREMTIGDFVFDDREADKAVRAFFQSRWPTIALPQWLMDLHVPRTATDEEVDELIACMNVTFAKVYEVTTRAKEPSREELRDFMFGPP